MKQKTKSGPRPGYFPVAKIAKWLQRSERRIQQMFEEGILPESNAEGTELRYAYNEAGTKYYYGFILIAQAYIAHLETQLRQGSKPLTEAKERKENIIANRQELKYKKELQQLVDVEAVTQLWSRIVPAFQNGIRSQGTRIAAQLPEEVRAKVQAIIEAENDRMLTDLSEQGHPARLVKMVEGMETKGHPELVSGSIKSKRRKK